MRNNVQIFNVKYENHCENCKHNRISDLYREPMCNLNKDGYIMYPEMRGSSVCPFLDDEDFEE